MIEKYVSIDEFVGKTFNEIVTSETEIHFIVSNDEKYKMYHDQDCCENVYLEDICGDINDLVDSPIIMACMETNKDIKPNEEYSDDSWTWTFYRIQTAKGLVVLRWYGESNGYYSEEVDICKM